MDLGELFGREGGDLVDDNGLEAAAQVDFAGDRHFFFGEGKQLWILPLDGMASEMGQ